MRPIKLIVQIMAPVLLKIHAYTTMATLPRFTVIIVSSNSSVFKL